MRGLHELFGNRVETALDDPARKTQEGLALGSGCEPKIFKRGSESSST
jgi:hypothetical protein